MITVAEWESGKVTLEDELFIPIYTHHPLVGNILIYFEGRDTKTKLEPAFDALLEYGANMKRYK